MRPLIHLRTICLVLAVLVVSYTNAQPPHEGPPRGPKKEKVEQLKIAFFTKELDLTTEEAEKFWPLYNEMMEKVHEQRKSGKKTADALRGNLEELSDAEIKTKMNAALDARIKEAELHKEYIGKIGEAVGYKKAAKVVSLEAQFRRELLKRLTEEKHGGPAAPAE
jgi:hypothetical protein